MKIIKCSLGFLVCLLAWQPLTANAYYPQHPEVQVMVDKAIDYLEGLGTAEIEFNQWGGQEYHIVLMAIAHFKARHDPAAKIVQSGLAQAKRLADEARSRRNGLQDPKKGALDKSTYAVSICIILMCEVDAETYKSDIEALRGSLLAVQQPHGGFGYPSEQQGDTSQVQYVVLAFWAMKQHGISVPTEPINRLQQWLLRVQDPSGAWPYRADDPGPGKGLIVQGTQYMSHSTALAGASSVLIVGDFFGIWKDQGKNKDGVFPGMPAAIRLADKPEAIKIDTSKSAVNSTEILAAVDRMNQYRKEVPYDKSGSTWHYYAMYSLERFESFHEMSIGANEEEPQWYDDGVEKLKRNQASVGGWGVNDRTSSPPVVATCFAILFLVRSTQQSIAAANTGTLAGGQGLPKDTTDIKVTGTKISGRPVAAEVGKMLDLLEEDAGDLEGKSIPDDLELADDPQQRRAQLDRLERLLRGSQSWQARRVAARLLGKSEQMRVVPTLIYALSDPDTSVRRYARDGLRFISRKFEGFGLSDQPNNSEIQQAQKLWREWYLRVNPKYVFLQE